MVMNHFGTSVVEEQCSSFVISAVAKTVLDSTSKRRFAFAVLDVVEMNLWEQCQHEYVFQCTVDTCVHALCCVVLVSGEVRTNRVQSLTPPRAKKTP